jgi:methylenetetrahydrofolate dehydrogenase (NADP+)/methenyltetrahydrofolate cyclohydrolase
VSAVVIDGRAIAASVRAEVKADLEASGLRAGLATVLVGDDPASAVYVAGKIRACEEVGIASIHHALPASVGEDEVVALIGELNERADVSGILLQLPVPEHLDGQALTALIDPDKDVDGLTPISAGRLLQNRPGLRPCTPAGILELLDRHSVAIEGANAVVVGRSDLVGKPVAQLLLHRNATVTMCHSRTRDLAAECRRADILIAAVGRPRIVQGDWVKPGATVIDVGINRTGEGPRGGLVGDVDFAAAAERAALITPVPGGVGPMTIAMLVRNTVAAALQKTAPRGAGSGG